MIEYIYKKINDLNANQAQKLFERMSFDHPNFIQYSPIYLATSFGLMIFFIFFFIEFIFFLNDI